MLQRITPTPRPLPPRAYAGWHRATRHSPRALPAPLPTGKARLAARADSRAFANWFLNGRSKRFVVTAPHARPWDWRLIVAPVAPPALDGWKRYALHLRRAGWTNLEIADFLRKPESTVKAVTLGTACAIRSKEKPVSGKARLNRNDAAERYLSRALRQEERDWLATATDALSRIHSANNATHTTLDQLNTVFGEDPESEYASYGRYRTAPKSDYADGDTLFSDECERSKAVGAWHWRPGAAAMAAIKRGNAAHRKSGAFTKPWKFDPEIKAVCARIDARKAQIARGLKSKTIRLISSRIATKAIRSFEKTLQRRRDAAELTARLTESFEYASE